jgi:hypothetical protein
MPTLSLDAIRQRIAKQNLELHALRRDLETRQNRLQSLAHRKKELEAKLRQIEAEMAAIHAGTKRPVAVAPKAAPKKKSKPAKAMVEKTTARAPAKPGQSKVSATAAPTKPSAAKAPQVPLRELLTQVLKRMSVPLKASELAEEVLNTGYQTSSKKFVNILYVMLGRMDNVEHVEGEGYRLKRKR